MKHFKTCATSTVVSTWIWLTIIDVSLTVDASESWSTRTRVCIDMINTLRFIQTWVTGTFVYVYTALFSSISIYTRTLEVIYTILQNTKGESVKGLLANKGACIEVSIEKFNIISYCIHYWKLLTLQLPPFRHGFDAHSLISVNGRLNSITEPVILIYTKAYWCTCLYPYQKVKRSCSRHHQQHGIEKGSI